MDISPSSAPVLSGPSSGGPIVSKVLTLGVTSGIAALAVFARETAVVRHFGATPISDAFYLTLAPAALFLAMFVAVAEIRFVPLIAADPFARRRELDGRAIRTGGAAGLLWLLLAGATLLLRGVPRFSPLPWMLGLEAGAMVPFALFAAHRSVLLARDQLGIANVATAIGTASGVGLIIVWGQPVALPASVLLLAIVQAAIVASAVAARSHAQRVPVLAVGGLTKLSISMILSASLTSVQRIVASGLGVGAVTALVVAERLYQLPATLVPASIAGAIFPRLARADQHEQVRTASAQAMSVVLALTLPVGIAGILFAPDAIRLISGAALQQHGEFPGAVAALRVFCVCIPLYATGVVQARILAVSGLESVVARVGVLAATVNLPAAIAGGLVWGVPGVAAANLVAFVCVDVYSTSQMWRQPWVRMHRIEMVFGRNLGLQVLLGVPGFAALLIIHLFLRVGLIRLGLASIAGIIATVGMLWPVVEHSSFRSLLGRLSSQGRSAPSAPEESVP